MQAAIIGLLIPFIAVIITLSIPIILIISDYSKKKMLHSERMTAIEKGIAVPMEPQKNKKQLPQPLYDLRTGIIHMGLGTAFILFAIFGNGWNPIEMQAAKGVAYLFLGIGFILSGIGLAKLIWYFIIRNKYQEPRSASLAPIRENFDDDED